MQISPEQAKRNGATVGGSVLAVIVIFATCIFPPVGILVAIVFGIIGICKLSIRSQSRRAAAEHQVRIRQFYDRCDQQQVSATWTNPGWRP